jgi:trk system potassium uptake protein TrkH
MILMVIGGSPFSTAGGIKVTTVALAFFALLPILRGEKYSLLLDRAQSLAHGAKSLAILLVSLLIVGVAIFILQCLGEPISLKMLLFEVVSALGTVGLSQGGTSMLSVGGLIVIMICMFLGRVGPPALLLSFTSAQMDPQRRPDSYVKEDLPLS